MRTEDLIAELAASGPAPAPLNSSRIAVRMLIAATAAAGVFLSLVGPRADIVTALGHPLVVTKTLLPALLAAIALPAAVRFLRPGAQLGARAFLFGVPAAIAAVLWIVTFARTAAPARFADVTPFSLAECLGLIIVISILPTIFALRLMRTGATTRPRLAGALTGLAVAACAATGYSFFCTQDNPLFYLTWYGTAIAVVSAAGAALGGRWLAW